MSEEVKNTPEIPIIDAIGTAFLESDIQMGMGDDGYIELFPPESAKTVEEPPVEDTASASPDVVETTTVSPTVEQTPIETVPEVPDGFVPKESYDNLRSTHDRQMNDMRESIKELTGVVKDLRKPEVEVDSDAQFSDEPEKVATAALSEEDREALDEVKGNQQVAYETMQFQARVKSPQNPEGDIDPALLTKVIPFMQLELERADQRGYDLTIEDAFNAGKDLLDRVGPLRSVAPVVAKDGPQPAAPQGTPAAPEIKAATPQESAEALHQRAARNTETGVSSGGEDTFRDTGKKGPAKDFDEAAERAWAEAMVASG